MRFDPKHKAMKPEGGPNESCTPSESTIKTGPFLAGLPFSFRGNLSVSLDRAETGIHEIFPLPVLAEDIGNRVSTF